MSIEKSNLEARLHALEDIEAIIKARLKYYQAVDERKWDEAADIYSEEVDADLGSLGKGKTKEEIKKILREKLGKGTSATSHLAHPSIVEVDGDTATATGYLETHSALPGSDETFSEIGRVNDEYIREKGKWKLKRVVYTTLLRSTARGRLSTKKL